MFLDRVRQAPKTGDVWVKRGFRAGKIKVQVSRVVATSVFVCNLDASGKTPGPVRELSLAGFMRWYAREDGAGNHPKRGK